MNERMKTILPGLKTKIAGYLPVVVAMLAWVGLDIDADQIAQFIENAEAWIIAGLGLYGGVIHWFRNLAN